MTRHRCSYEEAETKKELAHRQVALEAAREGIVLLKNNGALPVEPGYVAMYGPGVTMTVKGGTGSGEVLARRDVTILEGMEAAGFKISTKDWIKEYEELYAKEEEAFGEKFRADMGKSDAVNQIGNNFSIPFGRAVTESDIMGSWADVCFYVLTRQAGEGSDRQLDNGDNSLTPVERESIELCAKSYDRFILVLNCGCTFDLDFLDEIPEIDAVIFMCQQGSEGGYAFADVVSGKVSPSGKTVDTWAKKYTDIPNAMEYAYLNGKPRQEFYKEGIYVGYRYFDTFGVEPRFCFGYGLSYTDFSVEEKEVVVDKTKVSVKVRVTNTGTTYAGKEVVQVYVSCPQGKLHKEYQKLAAFAKTKELKPGESEELTLTFAMENLASYDEATSSYILEAGDYVLRVGNSSRNTAAMTRLALDQEVIVSRHKSLRKPEVAFEELVGQINYMTLNELVPVQVYAKDFETKTFTYEKPEIYHSEEVDRLMAKLTLEDAAHLCIGGGMRMMGQGAEFMPPYIMAPGSAGITTTELMGKGIPNVCCADGPAGLRIQRKSTETADGKIRMIDYQLSIMKYFPEEMKKEITGDPTTETMIYQFTTAFPVGMSLAQTFNMPLLEEVGYAVSEEMQQFGINYWLAPGMNIHRNPLCGRNFEYYSEDPLVAGRCAAAITNGVQRIQGNYTTIKHFCCNNQESDRNYTDAILSERALREIYLKGFEVCVKESHPRSLMTSYNLVNGLYVNNSEELMTGVLRNEWGFDGVVMTDWMATGVVGVKEPVGDDVLAVAGGNDLLMPGNDQAYAFLLEAVKEGKMEADDIYRAAANVLRSIVDTDIYKEFVAGV